MINDTTRAVILGIVEGITEYLPVSSTGHLILFGQILEFQGDRADSFDIVIQAGAILSVVVLYWRRFFNLFRGPYTVSAALAPGLTGLSGIAKLMAASIPPSILGLLLHKQIKEHLFHSTPIAWGLILGAFAMLITEARTKGSGTETDSITLKQSFLIGLFQCIALWPGMSRAAWTIMGGMTIGLSRRAAAEFSFLAAVPLILAASGFDLLKNYNHFSAADLELLAIGLFVSFVTAIVAVAAFIKLVQRVSLRPFAIYRILLGILVLWML